jgi:hypothetical protein
VKILSRFNIFSMEVRAMKHCRHRTIGVLCLPAAPGILLLVLGITACSPAEDAQRILDDALGYASIYNYEMTEKLCDRVLAMTQERDLQARACDLYKKAVTLAPLS